MANSSSVLSFMVDSSNQEGTFLKLVDYRALDTNRAICIPGLVQGSEVHLVIAGSEKCNIKTSPEVFKLSV